MQYPLHLSPPSANNLHKNNTIAQEGDWYCCNLSILFKLPLACMYSFVCVWILFLMQLYVTFTVQSGRTATSHATKQSHHRDSSTTFGVSGSPTMATSGSHQSALCLYNVVISEAVYSWNYTTCSF